MKQNTYKLPQQLLKAVNEERCILFLGAGASQASGLPSGIDLANILADELKSDFEKGQDQQANIEEIDKRRVELAMISQLYNDYYGTGRRAHERVANILADKERDARKEVLEPIKSIPTIREILTTNYDTLLEDIFDPYDYHVVYHEQDLRQPNRPTVELIKLHGTRTDTASMVLTDEDYRVYFKSHQALVDLTKTLLRKKILIVVGYSLEDKNIGQIYQDAIGSEEVVTNFFVSPEASLFQSLHWTKHGFHHIPLGAEQFFKALQDGFEASNYQENAASIPDRTPALIDSLKKVDPLNNPFVLYDTEALIEQNPELLFETFVPPVRFPTLLEHQHTFIEGHRGSGKSTALWSLSIKSQAYDNERDLPMWGFFVKMVPGWFTDFRRKKNHEGTWVESDREWAKFFTHYFNLLVLTGILQNISEALDLGIFTVNANLTAELQRIATRMLRFSDTDCTDIRALKLRVEEEIDSAVNDRATLPFYTTTTFISRVLDILASAIPELKNRWWHLLLDEYDNVYPEQQAVINVILRERNQKVRYKIAVKTLHAYLKDIDGKALDYIDDYGYLSCDSNMWDPALKPQYVSFLEELSRQRLKHAGYDEITIQELLPESKDEKYYAGFENYCYLSSGLTRLYLQLCKDAVYEAYPATATRKVDLGPISTPIQNHVAKIHSAILFTAYRETPEPHRVLRLFRVFGPLFRAIAKVTENQNEYRTPLSFELGDLDQLSDDSLEVLDSAIKARLLQLPMLPKQPQNPVKDSPAQKYSFHRLLAPFFKLSLTERYSVQVKARAFNNIWEHPDSVLEELSTGYKAKGIRQYLEEDLPLFSQG